MPKKPVQPGLSARLLLGAILALSVGVAAAAEPPTGSRLGDWRQRGPALSAKDQAEGARQMARCIYHQETPVVRAALLANSQQRSEANLKQLRNGSFECGSLAFGNDFVAEREIYIPDELLRGLFAEAALREEAGAVAALPPLPLKQQSYLRAWFVATGRPPSVDEMAACIADTNPAGAARLFATAPMTQDEMTALGSLTDSLTRCLQAGARLQAGRQALRAALADALYHRVEMPEWDVPPPAAAPVEKH